MPEAENLVLLSLRSLERHARTSRLMWRDGAGTAAMDAGSFLRLAAAAAEGLDARGIARGDRVGVACGTCAEWLAFDLAALSRGILTVPVFTNLSRENLEWELRDAAPRLILCGDGSQARALRNIGAGSIPLVSLAPEDGTIPWTDFLGGNADAGEFARRASQVGPADPATIIYTSGSTGRPKGVLLDHGALVFQVEGARAFFPSSPESDTGLTCLPLAHVFERVVAYYHLASGHPLALARDIQELAADLQAFHPSILTVVPRLLEKLLLKVDAQVAAHGGIAGRIGRAAMDASRRERNGLSRLADPILDALVWRRVREGMGGRLRLVVCGGAALPPSIEIRMRRMGMPILEGYGLTEHGPVVAANRPGASRPGTVGQPFPGVELRLDPDNELLVRSRSVFVRYWNAPGTDSALREDGGWLRTGDLASVDADGFLKLTGRKKDLCKTAGGKYVAPTPIEEALASHPLVEHAVVEADDRKFVSAVLALDPARLREMEREAGTEEGSAALSEAVGLEIAGHVESVNSRLNEWEKIRRWVVSPRPFTVEGGELTPTLKVRRHAVLGMFRRELDALYG